MLHQRHRAGRLGPLLLLLAACNGADPATPVPSDPPDTDGPVDTGEPTDTDPVDTDEPPDTDPPVDTDLPGCTTTQSTDADADGLPDAITTTRAGPGFRVVEIDTEGDGYLDQRDSSTFSVQGVLVAREVVTLPNNQLVRTEATAVDAQGRPVRTEIDADADGTLDLVTTWAYHPSGAIAVVESRSDLDDDGFPDQISSTTYDEAGLPQSTLDDQDGDGAPDAFQTWTWGEPRVHSFLDQDGLLIRAVRTTSDLQGRVIEVANDEDGDGTYTSTADQLWQTTYTPAGAIATYDGDGPGPDGLWDVRTTYTYDGSGRLVQRADLVAPDVLTGLETTVYDAGGRPVSVEYDLDGDGDIQDGWTRTYDSAGRVLTETTLFGGLPTYVTGFAYGADGLLAQLTWDQGGDGALDGSTTTTRDAFGREIRIEQDDTGDFVPESIYEFVYSCPP